MSCDLFMECHVEGSALAIKLDEWVNIFFLNGKKYLNVVNIFFNKK
jgi:hypothetical protein